MKERIRQLLFDMHRDPEGKKTLDEIMIDRFLAPREEWYNSIVAMKRNVP